MATTSSKPVALVTGGARRIGACISETLHQAGMTVLIHYRHSRAEAEQLCQRLNQQRPNSASLLQSDLEDPQAVRNLAQAALDQHQRLDLLVNNASSFYPTPMGEASDSDWDALIHSNLRAPFILSQALAPALAEQHGAIISIADVYAEKPLAGHSLYCIAKAGLVMMTKSLARELGPDVRVNAVAPGPILWPEQGQLSEQQILDATALKRSGTPADIASAVLWLGRQTPYITGQILAVDGGRSLSLHGSL